MARDNIEVHFSAANAEELLLAPTSFGRVVHLEADPMYTATVHM